ncbi:MAG: glycerol-3-phosphate dehydrogenase/oxidase [Cellvibrionaceae bacterium]
MSASTSFKKQYDLVIIGGGVQGAGVALLAQAAGYSVLQIEKNQWASGTSSKSSKLIHGGLRYLQTGQFKLVYECLTERQWMLNKMPSLVKPNWFYIPIYKDSHYSAWKIRVGLFLYSLLSGNSRYSQYKKIKKSEWSSLSGIKQENLVAVFAYQDAQTDDAMLTRALVKRSQELGADCFEKVECLDAVPDDKSGYRLKLAVNDKRNNDIAYVNCRTIVNATGPWVNETLSRLNKNNKPLSIELIQGSHLLISPQLSSDCFYMEAPQDQRAVFCLPWKEGSMIGTTELAHKGRPEEATVTETEIEYLTSVIKHYFPNYDFSVDGHFCGLRVLPVSDKKAFLRARDTIIHSDNHIISLYGGKLTGWRASAKKVLDEIDRCSLEGKSSRNTLLDSDNLF